MNLRVHRVLAVSAVSVLLMAQAPAEPAPQNNPGFEDICRLMLGERTDLMDPCIARQQEAHDYVMSWFAFNGLLTPEGGVDGLQLLEAQNDPALALFDTPAGTAAYCIESTSDWIALSECIAALDQGGLNSGFGLGPDPFGPGLTPYPGVSGAGPGY